MGAFKSLSPFPRKTGIDGVYPHPQFRRWGVCQISKAIKRKDQRYSFAIINRDKNDFAASQRGANQKAQALAFLANVSILTHDYLSTSFNPIKQVDNILVQKAYAS